MGLTTLDYIVPWLAMLLVTLWVNDYAWSHKTELVGDEIGYATILTWIRATGWMFLAMFMWAFMAQLTVAANSGINSFAGAGQGSILGLVPLIFYALFFVDLVVGITITLYLVLPIERLPKSFQAFAKANQRREEGREIEVTVDQGDGD